MNANVEILYDEIRGTAHHTYAADYVRVLILAWMTEEYRLPDKLVTMQTTCVVDGELAASSETVLNPAYSQLATVQRYGMQVLDRLVAAHPAQDDFAPIEAIEVA